jgi:N-acetylmuramoyl-L-alanine amidase
MNVLNKISVLFFLLFTLLSYQGYCQSTNFKVTLDAGHGAHDYGAVYSGRIEKNIALAIVLKVGKILEDHGKIDVIYTRKTDIFIDLIERANIANRSASNIFVSIHCNANKNTAADGTETYVMGMNKVASNLEAAKKENAVITLEKDYKKKYEGFDPNSPETMIGMTLMQEEYLENSISLASKIEERFGALGKKLRHEGVKQAPFMVLHKAYMPRVLVETGFISNAVEGDNLNSEVGQNAIAKAISDAIINYRNEYFGNGEAEIFDTKPIDKIVDKITNAIITSEKPIKVIDSSVPTNTNTLPPSHNKVEVPKIEVPKVVAPKIEVPKVEVPKVNTPKVDVPKVVTPKVEVPKVEVPKVEVPKVEVPKVEVPKVEVPKVEVPKVEVPKGEVPKVEVPKVEVPKVEVPKIDLSTILFKVQLFTSTKKLRLVSSNFMGLKNVSVVFENKSYKYMYGGVSDYETAKVQLVEARTKGFVTAFSIVYKNGIKISIQEVLK